MIRRFLISFLILANSTVAYCQSSHEFGDSSLGLSILSYLKLISENHPQFESYSIQKKIAESQLNQAKSGFDPILQFEEKEKHFSGLNYYTINTAQLLIPTLSPIQFTAGSETNNGKYVNPEISTNSNQLNYAGIELSLLKNLLFDKRRLDVAKGKNSIKLAENQIQLNKMDLIQKSAQDFINWYTAFQQVKLWDSAVMTVKSRMEATRNLFRTESANLTDTVETFIQYQTFVGKLKEAQVLETKLRWIVSSNLWHKLISKGGIDYYPVDLKTGVFPSSLFIDNELVFNPELNQLENLPDIGQAINKIEALNLELKLRKNNLLPKLDFKFQYLSNSMQTTNQNYRMGLSFSSPLFMMQSRAELKEFNQRKRDSELQLELKKREITAKRNGIIQQIQLSNSLYQTQKGIEKNMKLLMDFEFTKFQLGESSMFILNNRESRLWESKIKTKEVQNKLWLNYIDYLRLNGEILNYFSVH